MSKKKKRILILACLLLFLAIGIGIAFRTAVQDYESALAAISIEPVHLENIEDGSYFGAYDARIISVEVEVDVKDHQIVHIDLLKHQNGKGQPAEAIIPEVIAAQSLQVDAVSGATSSSKVILKAIQVALETANK